MRVFEEHRSRLFGLAYRLLGSAAEAEDAVQDAAIRWHLADRGAISVPAAWLTTVVTNLCLTRLTAARARREHYVGTWLPEPVLTADGALGPLETAAQRDLVSLGVLVLMERLTPIQRAVFVLAEAFDYPHREIATILDVEESHSRQLLHRAREHIATERRRFTPDRSAQQRIVSRFLAATLTGDLAGLEQLLAEDVVSWADGGGTTAARRAITGKPKVLRYLLGLSRHPQAALVHASTAEVNGHPAALLRIGDTLTAILAPALDGDRIVRLHLIVNSAKLTFAAGQLR
ncbi:MULTISPECIES: RNA polymerase sigma factor SigJ [unclassified Crossiella]|uniref:RNA polymerase sigma factor SigJ n=1 Tax=unclassified Crossiella TaxID=2620835 RepID=UPI001FFF0DFD|nr:MULTISPECIES: RNA polymerase sigma factor SigJ [unclassified Crossiella]MCK2239148.1 RNA polymerase sigma factor SigJ [Crossiella sp. S99.2]MCK2251283.1 RNA polymerase sigma factor SigJ [Crossiella sp. S99.1]